MAVLKDLSQLGTVIKTEPVPPPTEAFKKLEPPPPEAFGEPGTPKRKRGEHPCYVMTVFNKVSNRQYAQFYLAKSFVEKHLKPGPKTRFKLVQGNEGYKQWFELRRGEKGNRPTKNGHISFFFADIMDPKKLEKGKHYPLQTVKRDGIIYFCLPPELVPLLR